MNTIQLNLDRYSPSKDLTTLFSYSFFEDKDLILKNPANFSPILLNSDQVLMRHQEAMEVYYHYLPFLAQELNSRWNRQLSLKFWHPFFVYGLSTVINIVLDRCYKLENYFKSHETEHLCSIINFKQDGLFLDDYELYSAMNTSIDFNYFLSSIALKSLSLNNLQLKQREGKFTAQEVKKYPLDNNFSIDQSIDHLAGFGKFSTKLLEFAAKLNKKRQISLEEERSFYQPTHQFQERSIDWKSLLLKCIPQNYFDFPIDQYSVALKKSVYLCSSYKHPIEKRASIGLLREVGKKVFLVQHGSHYGDILASTRNCLSEFHLDGFLSWGWKNYPSHPGHITPLPSPAFSKLYLRRKLTPKSKKIIYVSNVIGPTDAASYSIQDPDFFYQYYQNCRQFTENLGPHVKENFFFRGRLTHQTAAFDFQYQFATDFPNISFLKGNLDHHMTRANLAIHDNVGSSMHKSMAMNMPTVLLWSKDQNYFQKDLQDLVEELLKAEILFHDPYLAAQHVNQYYNHINDWWKRKDVQAARLNFCKKLSWVDLLYLPKWFKAIKNL